MYQSEVSKSVHIARDDLTAEWHEISHGMGGFILGSSSEISDQSIFGMRDE